MRIDPLDQFFFYKKPSLLRPTGVGRKPFVAKRVSVQPRQKCRYIMGALCCWT